ncbi:hypothetical protein [Streptomyces sp. NPDC089919]|uniref:hypothetical protein n=1 Tax=Streptomyces sp. NPDC089919 TaxID=3155188 RepID=UPI003414298D
MPAILGGRPQCTALAMSGRRCNAVANTGDTCKIHAERARRGAYQPDRQYRPGIIYALTDRWTGGVRYIGQTNRPPAERLAQHLHAPPNQAFRRWLTACDQQVDVKVLRDGVPASEMDAAEYTAIRAHFEAGCDLLNEAGVTRPFTGYRVRGSAPGPRAPHRLVGS